MLINRTFSMYWGLRKDEQELAMDWLSTSQLVGRLVPKLRLDVSIHVLAINLTTIYLAINLTTIYLPASLLKDIRGNPAVKVTFLRCL